MEKVFFNSKKLAGCYFCSFVERKKKWFNWFCAKQKLCLIQLTNQIMLKRKKKKNYNRTRAKIWRKMWLFYHVLILSKSVRWCLSLENLIGVNLICLFLMWPHHQIRLTIFKVITKVRHMNLQKKAQIFILSPNHTPANFFLFFLLLANTNSNTKMNENSNSKNTKLFQICYKLILALSYAANICFIIILADWWFWLF